MDSSPVRRTRAYSVGGSQYDAVNSGNVVRTDKQTGKKTTITGGEMHTALEAGVKAKHARAVKLQEQIDLHKSGKGLTSHHPMGCAEARAEAAIAAHHFQQPFLCLKFHQKIKMDGVNLRRRLKKKKGRPKLMLSKTILTMHGQTPPIPVTWRPEMIPIGLYLPVKTVVAEAIQRRAEINLSVPARSHPCRRWHQALWKGTLMHV
jgi:hypothetical protein